MAITRKLNEISVTFDGLGNVSVKSMAIITDDVEETTGGWTKNWNAQQVKAAAEGLRDAVLAQSAGQGRPLTF